MILDTLSNSAYYESAHPLFVKAFEFLRSAPIGTMESGRYEIDGDLVYAMIQTPEGRSRGSVKLECHRKYIDLQFVVSGNEVMGWSPLSGLGHSLGFDEKSDCGFYKDSAQSWFDVRPGCFAVFFPGDAHAPCCGTGICRKVVIKIAVQP